MKNSTMLLSIYCVSCGSTNIKESIEPDSSVHYARATCSDCGQFIKWIAQQPKHQKLIDIALASGRVSGWENLFLRNIRTRKHLSPKQLEKFEQILSRHQIQINPVPSLDTG